MRTTLIWRQEVTWTLPSVEIDIRLSLLVDFTFIFNKSVEHSVEALTTAGGVLKLALRA